MAEPAAVTSIFTSTLLRTRQTAAPLADRLGVQPRETPPPKTFAERVFAGVLGQTVLVVGHSNTVPQIIDALGATPVPVIDESEFDNLFVVTVASPQDARLLHLKYGEPST
jgi:broad specificity phosphatase PhoE